MKFKVGDKVRVVKNITDMETKDEYVGNVYTITHNYGNHTRYGQTYSIGQQAVVYEDELELAEFTKADLKDGMVVEYRDGSRRMIMGDNIMGDVYHNELKFYTHTLESPSFDALTIYKVYKSTATTLNEYFKDENLTLIWERESVKEMTITEIEKELGYKVKIKTEN
jgi:hypothetical protein